MKTKITLFIFSLFLSLASFAQLETFDGLTTNSWTSTANIYITDSGEIIPTGTISFGDFPFTATSPSFSLLASETYVYDIESWHYFTELLDAPAGTVELSSFTSIVLIDATDTVVLDFTSSIVGEEEAIGGADGFAIATGVFFVPTSGVYRLQLTGRIEAAEEMIPPIVNEFEYFEISNVSI